MQKRKFVKNAFWLTATSLILRFVGVYFRIWLSNKIGAEGMGLYQLEMSVFMLFAVFAASGLTTAVTRQVTDYLSLNNKAGAKKSLKVSFYLTAILAFASSLCLFLFAKPIAVFAIKDVRAYKALKIAALALPFMGTASIFKGYFLARRNAQSPSLAIILEQTVRIAAVFFMFYKYKINSLANATAAVLLADALSEGCSMIFLSVGFIKDYKKIGDLKPFKNYKNSKALKKLCAPKTSVVLKNNLSISVPITLGKYLSTGLRTLENLLVPRSLSKYTFSYKNSLTQFGMIKGMALPILFFPSSLLGSVTTLLIPELSEAKVKNNSGAIKKAVDKSVKITLYFGFIAAVIFYFAAEKIGVVIYKNASVGFLIKALSPLVPIMYLDSLCDGLLKGLDKQKAVFFHSFFDSVLRITLILAVVPFFGMTGFLIIMFLSNIFTCFLNARKLFLTAKEKPDLKNTVILPLIFALFSGSVSFALCEFFKINSNMLYLIIFSLIAVVIFVLCILAQNAFKISKIKGFLS